jgi:hypothetical protein
MFHLTLMKPMTNEDMHFIVSGIYTRYTHKIVICFYVSKCSNMSPGRGYLAIAISQGGGGWPNTK